MRRGSAYAFKKSRWYAYGVNAIRPRVGCTIVACEHAQSTGVRVAIVGFAFVRERLEKANEFIETDPV